MPTYRVVYGDEDNRVTEEFRDVVLEREDGWIVFFRGDDAILRVHVGAACADRNAHTRRGQGANKPCRNTFWRKRDHRLAGTRKFAQLL